MLRRAGVGGVLTVLLTTLVLFSLTTYNNTSGSSRLGVNFVVLRSRGSACSLGFVGTTGRIRRGLNLATRRIIVIANVPRRNSSYCGGTYRLTSSNYSVIFTSDFNRRSGVVHTTGRCPSIRFYRTANAGTRARGLTGFRGTFTSVCRNHCLTNVTTNVGLGRVVRTNGFATSRTGVNCINTGPCTRIGSNVASFFLNTHSIYPATAVRIGCASS